MLGFFHVSVFPHFTWTDKLLKLVTFSSTHQEQTGSDSQNAVCDRKVSCLIFKEQDGQMRFIFSSGFAFQVTKTNKHFEV